MTAPPVPLGEVIEIIMGQAPAGRDCNKDGHGTPFVKAGEFGKSRPVIREWTTDPKKQARHTDVLICVVGATCGKLNLGADCAIGRSVAALRPSGRLDQTYLYYFMLGLVDRMRGGALGAAQTVISKAMLAKVLIPLPPLKEQKRIVALLDQAFAALDRAETNIANNLVDAEEIMAGTISATISTDELGPEQPLGGHVDLLSGFAFKSNGYSTNPADIRLVRGDNIIQGGFRWEGVKRWPNSDRASYSRYELAENDVLIAMDRTWVSAGIKFAIVDQAALPSLLVQRVARLRALDTVLPRYLGIWIASRAFEQYVLSIQTGLGVPHVSGQQLKDFMIRVPSLDVQAGIIERLDRMRELTHQLIAETRVRKADVSELRQSILHRAFTGQLT